MGREAEVMAELLPDFERLHPGIHVKMQQVPWTAAHEKLLTAFAGGTTPDICQLGNTWIPEFVALKALEPLDRLVGASSGVPADDYFPGIWDTNVVDGTLYGVPWYVDTRLLFYRRDLLHRAGFSSPPTSWDEWKQMLAAVDQDGRPDRHAIFLPLNEFEPLAALALQQDDPLLRDGGRWGNFQSAGFRRALSFYVEMFQRGWAPQLASAAVANVWTAFGRGDFSFYISGPWNIGELKRRLPPDQQPTWMTAPLPGPDGPGSSIAGGASLVVFRSSRRQTAAWQLIAFLAQPSVQRRFHALTGDLPPRRATAPSGTTSTRARSASSSSESSRRRKCPNGSASPPRSGWWRSAPCTATCRSIGPPRSSMPARTASSRSAAGSSRGRASETPGRRLGVRRARLAGHRGILPDPGAGRA